MSKVRKANWFLFALVCVYLGGSFLLSLVKQKVELPYNLLVMSGQILIGVAFIGYVIVTRGNPLKLIKHERLGIVDILLVALIMLLVLPLVYFVNAVSLTFTENAMTDTMLEMIDNPYFVNLAMIALTPAILEEMVCRGILYHSYKTRNAIFAMLMSAFVFGLLHMNINQMLYAIVIGIVMIIVMEAAGSIYSTMLMHFIMNSISVTMMAIVKLLINSGIYSKEIFEEAVDMQNEMGAGVPVTLSIVLIIIGLLVVIATGACAAALIIFLAKRRGHYEELKALFKKQMKDETTATDVEDNKKPGVWYIVREYGLLSLSILMCLAVMIFL